MSALGIYNFTSQSPLGQSLPGATIAVYEGVPATDTLAALFADPAGATPLANPAATDGLGNLTFCAVNGYYTIVASGPGIEGTFTQIITVGSVGSSQTPSSPFVGWIGTPFVGIGCSSFSNIQSVPPSLTSALSLSLLEAFVFNSYPNSSTPPGTALYALPMGSSAASITAWSITSNAATFTANNDFVPGQYLSLSGFSTSTFFNGHVVTVLPAGLSSSAFTVQFTHANGSNTESGTASPSPSSGNLGTIQSWAIVNDVLAIYGNHSCYVGTQFIPTLLTHGSYLNGQTFTSTFYGGVINASYTASNDSAEELGFLYVNGVYVTQVIGWQIVSDVLTVFVPRSGSALASGSFTLMGLVHGSYLNGISFTVNAGGSNGQNVALAPISAANDSATESGDVAATLPYSVSSFVPPASSAATVSIGSLISMSIGVQLLTTGAGRVWAGCVDSTQVFGPVPSGPPQSGLVELATDAPSCSFIGFRYSAGAGDSSWQCIVNNQSSQTVVNSGILVDTNHHVFGITIGSGPSVSFVIDGNTVATVSSGLPPTSQILSPITWVDNDGYTTEVAAAVFTSHVWQKAA